MRLLPNDLSTPSASDVISPTWRAWATPAVSAASAAVFATAVLLHDPHASGSWGVCPVYALTGHYCPGCGSLRALHDLAMGSYVEGVGHNLLVIPALVWLGWWWLSRAAAAAHVVVPDPPSSQRFCRGLLVVLALFTVLRNVPGSPLAP
jgi:Protein of unknown function (DUF2752)